MLNSDLRRQSKWTRSAICFPVVTLALLCLVVLGGCGPRLASETSISLPDNNEIRSIVLDAVSAEQTIHVTATSDAAAINSERSNQCKPWCFQLVVRQS